VRDQLIKFGVRPEVLQMKGYGESKPKMSNDTNDGKFHNRRIEYSVIKN
jgi:OmpA-OmpF porin, OOP family